MWLSWFWLTKHLKQTCKSISTIVKIFNVTQVIHSKMQTKQHLSGLNHLDLCVHVFHKVPILFILLCNQYEQTAAKEWRDKKSQAWNKLFLCSPDYSCDFSQEQKHFITLYYRCYEIPSFSGVILGFLFLCPVCDRMYSTVFFSLHIMVCVRLFVCPCVVQKHFRGNSIRRANW